jgi:predicted alpha/beta superfamily hydrolase
LSRLKTGVLVVAAILAAAISGGIVGGAAAVALVRNAYNGPVESAALPELLVNSDELGEPMTLRVHLPIEYTTDPDRTFPVLWVLDGHSQGALFARSMQTLSRIEVAEPSIVVEVPSSSRGRQSDFIPPWENGPPNARADRFLRFLEGEAIPAVAKAYRANGARVLVGHSMGGLFTLYALLQTPSLFNGYFAFSPSVWIADEQILGELERAAPAASAVPTRLFLSLGETEGNQMLSGFRALETVLASWPASGLRWQATITGGADHGSNPELSFPVAARWYSGR